MHGSDRRGNEAAVLQLLPLLKSDTGGRTNNGEGGGDGGNEKKTTQRQIDTRTK